MASVSLKFQKSDRTLGFVLSLLILLSTPGIILWYTWWGRFRYHSWLMQGIVYATLALVLVVNHRYFETDLRSQGLRLDNFLESARLVLPVTLACAAAILCYGFWSRHWHFEQLSKIRLYLVWGVAQQYALQNILLARSKTVVGNRPFAILIASVLFALIHLPSLGLVLGSFVGSVIWCWIFNRVPNLWTLALSHSMLAVLLLFSTGLGFKIGKQGYRYQTYGGGVLVAGGYFKDGKPFIATLPGHDDAATSQVRLFSPDGTFIRQWTAYPEYGFSGNLAVGDLGSGSGDMIAVAPGPGPDNPRKVRIFDAYGHLQFEFDVPGKGFYGAYVSIGCRKVYVTPGPAPTEEGTAYEFDSTGKLLRKWPFKNIGLVNSIRALPIDPVRTGPADKSCPEHIALFGTPISINPSTIFLLNPEDGSIRTLASSAPTFGLNGALFRRSSMAPALLTAPGPLRGYAPHIRIYNILGDEIYSRVAYADPDACGSNVAALDVDGDGNDEIILGEGVCRDSPPTVRIQDFSGEVLYSWDAYLGEYPGESN